MEPKFSPKLLKQLGIDSPAAKVKEALEESRPVQPEILESMPGESIRAFLEVKYDKQGLQEVDFEKEDLLKKVHKLLIVGATTKQISDTLSISNKKANELRAELRKRLAADLKKLDATEIIAESVAFYDFIRAKAVTRANRLEGAGLARIIDKDLIAWYTLAMQANSAKSKFLIDSGLFDTRVEEDDTKQAAQNDLLQRMLVGTIEGDTISVDLDDIEEDSEEFLRDV